MGGTIANATTTICSGDDVDAFTNPVSPSGGSSYTYVWQYNNANLSATPGDGDPNWTDIGGSNSLTYDPGTIAQSTLYTRKATAGSGCAGSQYSNAIEITANPKPITGNMYIISNGIFKN